MRDVLEQGEAKIRRVAGGLEIDRIGNHWFPEYDHDVTGEMTIEQELIRVKYQIVDGTAVQPYAYPVRRGQ